ncbi:MAG TPA: acetyl-CoA C-acetyltransferase [Vicinamibacterales bacterium]|nr:acetyl-CoA C-acetyltransferase [Vicinamibacterales bacterium]
MPEAVIVSAVRTATGKFLGALKGFSAPQLGALVVADAVRRAGIDPATVDECIMGNVVSAGLGQNPARQAALRGGLSVQVGAVTINKVCGSGLKAVMLAHQGIATGDIGIAVAGGMESMSNCPYLMPKARDGARMGNAALIDSMVNDGLWCAFENYHMGNAGEVVAEQYQVGRDAQDAFAVRSHHKAAQAADAGAFTDEILPVPLPQRDGSLVLFDRDESVRGDTSVEALRALKPAFKKDGTVTAGNAPPVNDGASALVVMSAQRARELGVTPLARIVGQATSGLAPKLVLMTPVDAVRTLTAKIGWSLADVDLIELNEAFAVQAVAVMQELGLDEGRVNVNGGAVALGHAIGSSGSRVLTTLLYSLIHRHQRRGIATLCLGGGNGVAMAVEML